MKANLKAQDECENLAGRKKDYHRGLLRNVRETLSPLNLKELRHRAEEILQDKTVSRKKVSPDMAARLIHELEIQKIELALQTEELQQAQMQLFESRDRMADLYDFAPVGYLTLDDKGRIAEANLAAATLMGEERHHILGRLFPYYLVDSDIRRFGRLLEQCRDQQRLRGEFCLWDSKDEGRTVLVDIRRHPGFEGQDQTLLSITDITELKRTQAKLEHLTEQLLTLQEQERERIARDLHDDLGQSLMVLKMQLNAVKKGFSLGEEPWEEFGQAIDFVNTIAEQVRDVSRSLHPSVLENLGLKVALQQLLEEFQKYHGLRVLEKLEDLAGLLSPEAEMAVYRIFQECLNNATRHGQATRARLGAQKQNGAVHFFFEDNGAGFDPEEIQSRGEGLGLITMEERVGLLHGSFKITSVPGRGTRIVFSLPANSGKSKTGVFLS